MGRVTLAPCSRKPARADNCGHHQVLEEAWEDPPPPPSPQTVRTWVFFVGAIYFWQP